MSITYGSAHSIQVEGLVQASQLEIELEQTLKIISIWNNILLLEQLPESK